jgi:hypothetical protein
MGTVSATCIGCHQAYRWPRPSATAASLDGPSSR